MRMKRVSILATTIAAGLVLAGCSSTPSAPVAAGTSAAAQRGSTTSAAPTSAAPSPSCTLPDSQDLIVRDDDPQAQILAQEIGEVNLENCTPTLSNFQQTAGQAAGECTTIAWAKDNPGYDVNAVPAAPLKKVIESAGPGC